MNSSINKLNDCIASTCGLTSDSIAWNDSLNLIDDLFFDSLSLISLIVQIESLFGLEFDDDSLLLTNISSYNYLKRKIMDESQFEEE